MRHRKSIESGWPCCAQAPLTATPAHPRCQTSTCSMQTQCTQEGSQWLLALLRSSSAESDSCASALFRSQPAARKHKYSRQSHCWQMQT
jgi:hypothetical protein